MALPPGEPGRKMPKMFVCVGRGVIDWLSSIKRYAVYSAPITKQVVQTTSQTIIADSW